MDSDFKLKPGKKQEPRNASDFNLWFTESKIGLADYPSQVFVSISATEQSLASQASSTTAKGCVTITMKHFLLVVTSVQRG